MAKGIRQIVSHWYHLTEGLQASPQVFYAALEEALNVREIPRIRVSRIEYKEGGLFSAKREYLRVRRGSQIFDVCAAPFGTGFFVSWWLAETPSSIWIEILYFIPFIGPLLVRAFQRSTYFRLDTALMFQESVHAAVVEVLEHIMKDQGVNVLSETEKRPILGRLFSH